MNCEQSCESLDLAGSNDSPRTSNQFPINLIHVFLLNCIENELFQ